MYKKSGMTKGVEYYDWILRTGKTFTITKEPVERGEMKKCYYNAQNLALDGKVLYFEGWATTKTLGIPFEHGFNAVNNIVIDPTWTDGDLYFGINIPVDYIKKHWIKSGMAESLLPRYYLEKGKNESKMS
jgi:hypothetical protein